MSEAEAKNILEGPQAAPVWARENAFPKADGGYGWISRKGRRHRSDDLGGLQKAIRTDRESHVELVWTPECEYCRVPEEVLALRDSIATVRGQWVRDDQADSRHRLKWFGGGIVVWLLYTAVRSWFGLRGFEQANGLDLSFTAELVWLGKALLSSTAVGIALLAFLLFAFIPWYQAEKSMREFRRGGGRSATSVSLVRFESWLAMQRSPVTFIFMGIIGVVFLAQVFSEKSLMIFEESVMRAGLVKSAYFNGDWGRLFTAPMLHGGVIHMGMNALALLYLGKRVEIFARWPHVPMVFLFAALVGGEASARLLATTSVGASGGLMGLLGFLLVFETLHSQLIPRSARRRLIGGVVLTGVIGLIGYKFIDNAAHVGGLVAGLAYAFVVFPKSASAMRPKSTRMDLVLGSLSLLVLVLSAGYAVMRIVGM